MELSNFIFLSHAQFRTAHFMLTVVSYTTYLIPRLIWGLNTAMLTLSVGAGLIILSAIGVCIWIRKWPNHELRKCDVLPTTMLYGT
ncbi:MAG: hypothetical protein VYA34_11185 [Myxococcota bacterium]|nr:hypothetical protein [Myxococcota bacterium]